MIRPDVSLEWARDFIVRRHQWKVSKCDVIQEVFLWELTWTLLEPVYQAFWEACPEAEALHQKRLQEDDLSPEEEELEWVYMQDWGLDQKGEIALAPFWILINWQTGKINVPRC